MALYDYKCKHCNHIFEVEHPMSERPKIHCPQCHQEAQRLISSPAIKFKGNGFYNTDSGDSSHQKSV